MKLNIRKGCRCSCEWKVTDIFLKDNKDNTVHLSNLSTQSNGEKIDFSTLTLNVSGVTTPPVSTDNEPPVIHTISVESKDLNVNDTVNISAEISDNDSGVSSVIILPKAKWSFGDYLFI